MDFWYIWVLPAIGGLIWFLITSAAVKAPGSLLAGKFAKLQQDSGGKIAGVSLEKAKAYCGQPSSVASMGNGQTLYQWQATGYHIALLFDENNICLGVSSETKV